MLFLDGTWNEDSEDRAPTNIVYLRERLNWELNIRRRRGSDDHARLPADFQNKPSTPIVVDGFEYVVKYLRGVGTGPFDRLRGALFGVGLEDNIRRAYKFLSDKFRPGDEIFVFGFSRGAFTARSLCGFLDAVGLLKREHCTQHNEEQAWRYYRTPPEERLSAEREYFSVKSLVHDERTARVRALCVFDTVGALGIPLKPLWRYNRSRYAFHDTDISSAVDIRLHALSLDEPRQVFEPTLWTKPKATSLNNERSPTEQVWFPGAHSDVGGGYIRWQHEAARETGLSDLPLAWMIQRLNWHLQQGDRLGDVHSAHRCCVQPQYTAPIPFYASDLLAPTGELNTRLQTLAVSALQHEPGTAWRCMLFSNRGRAINHLEGPHTSHGRGMSLSDPLNQAIHVSAFYRLRNSLTVHGRVGWWFRRFLRKHRTYRPMNLTTVVPYVAATYLKRSGSIHATATPWNDKCAAIFSWRHITVVDWTGRLLDPSKQEDVARVIEILPTPKQIGIREIPSQMARMAARIEAGLATGMPVEAFDEVTRKPTH
jgi:hypothetical protein